MNNFLKFNNIEIEVLKSVYFPREDSFLLLQSLEDVKKIKQKKKLKILEMFCGSGICGIYFAKNMDCEITFVDLNEEAIKCVKKNCKINKIKNTKFIISNLFDKLKDEKFDIILANPPYLPTKKNEKLKDKENLAYDGGIDGRKTINLFLKNIENHLKKDAKLYLIESSLSDPKKTKIILEKKRFKKEILREESFFFEKLFLSCYKKI